VGCRSSHAAPHRDLDDVEASNALDQLIEGVARLKDHRTGRRMQSGIAPAGDAVIDSDVSVGLIPDL
jgi:hypothetical protein